MWQAIQRVILGVSTAPAVVAAARSVVLYLLPLGVGALIATVAAISDPRWLWLTALLPLVRALEGALLDQVWKSSQNDRYPAPPAGQGTPPAVPPD